MLRAWYQEPAEGDVQPVSYAVGTFTASTSSVRTDVSHVEVTQGMLSSPGLAYGGVYTHLQAQIVSASGVVAQSALVEVNQPVPAYDPPSIDVDSYRLSGSSLYYSVGLVTGRRMMLKGELCQAYNSCRWRLYGVDSSGYISLLRNDLTLGDGADGYAPYEVRRLFAEVYRTDGSQSTMTQMLAVDGSRRIDKGVDPQAVTALLVGVSSAELCLPLNAYARSPLDGSVTTAYAYCDGLVSAGTPRASIVSQLVARYGRTVATALLGAAAAQDTGTRVDAPPAVPGDPPSSPDPSDPASPPYRAGDPYQPSISRLANNLLSRKTTTIARRLTADEANIAARRCYQVLSRTGYEDPAACGNEPVFFTGSDNPEATQHDAEAQAQHPEWVRLTRGDNPTAKRWWYNAYSPCAGKRPTGMACDEYPFWSTEQGGREAPGKPRASLKEIPGPDNRDQGSRLVSFYTVCKITKGRGFYVVPLVPRSLGVATVGVC